MERDHWDKLFDELYLRTYARLDRGESDEREALGAVALAGVEPGADVLDAPCGYGRHSIVLARAGYRVVGIDRSLVLLEEARRRAGDGEWPRWMQADHRELPFEDASVDASLNLYTATELVRLVEEAGFTIAECYGGWDREELSRETRLVLVARVP